MKKKILAMALVVAMLAIAVASGSLAWFTDNDKTTNTFTVGSVKIQQNEDFTQNSQLLPIVNIMNPSRDPNYVKKVVTVTNEGKNDAYIRTFIAIPKALEGKLHLDLDNVDGFYSSWKEEDTNLTIWEGDVEYVVYCYVYNHVLGTQSNNRVTPVLLKGVYLDASVDMQENPNENNRMEFCWKDDEGEWVFSGFAVEDATKVNVLVATQAVQADGFGYGYRASSNALNAAFGSVNQSTALPFSAE